MAAAGGENGRGDSADVLGLCRRASRGNLSRGRREEAKAEAAARGPAVAAGERWCSPGGGGRRNQAEGE